MNFLISANTSYDIILLLFNIPILLIAFSIHEASHGFAAYKCGDPTARNLGRLTMNPLKHLDLVGTICMIFFGVGWAKPVPVNTRHFRKPKRDMAITALAGPLSNIALSLISLIICIVLHIFLNPISDVVADSNYLYSVSISTLPFLICFFLYYFSLVNLTLAIFNMIPVPPLDGSRIAFIFLPDKIYFGIMRYEQIIKIIFLLLVFYTGFSFIFYLSSLAMNGLVSLAKNITSTPSLEYLNINNYSIFLQYLLLNNGG